VIYLGLFRTALSEEAIFQFLDQVREDFAEAHGNEIDSVSQKFAFLRFGQ